jgi:hypothetical protein
MRRQRAKLILKNNSHIWPINPTCAKKPENWKKWPNNKKFCLVLSHDVDTQKGHDSALRLLEIEQKLGLRASYNFVPERYNLSLEVINEVKRKGFAVSVHGLKHDGLLFTSREIFLERAKKINHYLKLWGTRGFTAPSMIHNLAWMGALDISCGTTTFDTDPFEPQPDPINTIYPFVVKSKENNSSYVEMPYTLPQDFTLYVILNEKTNDIWKSKLDWIAENGGMALLNTHPDYMNFGNQPNGREEYSIQLYTDFLEFIMHKYENQYWNALPMEVADYVNNKNKND